MLENESFDESNQTEVESKPTSTYHLWSVSQLFALRQEGFLLATAVLQDGSLSNHIQQSVITQDGSLPIIGDSRSNKDGSLANKDSSLSNQIQHLVKYSCQHTTLSPSSLVAILALSYNHKVCAKVS